MDGSHPLRRLLSQIKHLQYVSCRKQRRRMAIDSPECLGLELASYLSFLAGARSTPIPEINLASVIRARNARGAGPLETGRIDFWGKREVVPTVTDFGGKLVRLCTFSVAAHFDQLLDDLRPVLTVEGDRFVGDRFVLGNNFNFAKTAALALGRLPAWMGWAEVGSTRQWKQQQPPHYEDVKRIFDAHDSRAERIKQWRSGLLVVGTDEAADFAKRPSTTLKAEIGACRWALNCHLANVHMGLMLAELDHELAALPSPDSASTAESAMPAKPDTRPDTKKKNRKYQPKDLPRFLKQLDDLDAGVREGRTLEVTALEIAGDEKAAEALLRKRRRWISFQRTRSGHVRRSTD